MRRGRVARVVVSMVAVLAVAAPVLAAPTPGAGFPVDSVDSRAGTDAGGAEDDSVVTPANGSAVIGLDKVANPSTLAPGQETEFAITVSCSSLEVPCANLTVTDTLPAEFDVTSLPASNSQRTVTYDAGTRLLTVAFIVPLGGGSVGLPAGSSQAVAIGMRLPNETTVVDGQVITNTADATADAADPAQDSAEVTATIPVIVDAVATKSWEPTSGLALSGEVSELVLGVRNTSTSSSSVTQLAVLDESPATFDRFDLTGAGTVDVFPPGADQVVIEVCTLAVGTACGFGDWIEGAPQPGPALSLPAGVAAEDVTGIRYRFADSGGALLPYSTTPSEIRVPLVLRDTLRSTGAPLNPTSTEQVTNCAVPEARPPGPFWVVGAAECATYAILPGDVRVGARKELFPDSNGNYLPSGTVVAGQSSGVSMRITATNDSAFPVALLRIAEPSPSALSEFDKLSVDRGRLTFPDGATEALVEVTCRSGGDPAPLTVERPTVGDVANLASLGCASGVAPASVTVTFAATSPTGDPLLLPGGAGILELHGEATGATMADVTDGGIRNCAEVSLSSEGEGTGSATADACASVAVAAPNPSLGGVSKSTSGVTTITPGQDLTFTLQFRNNGNVPLTNIVLVDPPDPTAASNPFGLVRLTALRAATSTPASTLEVFDPVAGDYVPWVPSDAALAERATGLRVRVTGTLAVGSTFRVTYSVRLRDDAPPDASFRNCAAVGIDDPTTVFCGPTISAAPPSSGGSLNKVITPTEVLRPQPGLPAQQIDVRHRVANTGTLNLRELVVTDADSDFFDAATFAGSIRVNFPIGANRVRVDACTSPTDCAAGTWVLGTATRSVTPGLPAGVGAAAVRGLRFTFTNSSGDYTLLPSATYPTGGGCPNATVCFAAVVRATLASDPATPVPATLTNTSAAEGESQLQAPGTTFPIPEVAASVAVLEGTPELALTKGPESRIGPGDVAPVSLVATNTGTDAVADPVVVDPLPADLTFDPAIPGGSPAAPYLIDFTLPPGIDPPPTVTFTAVTGDPATPPLPGCTDPNRVCALSWSFPGWSLPPGARIALQFDVRLTPGVLAGTVITNTAGASGADPDLACDGASVVDDPLLGPGRFCTASTTITSLAGNDFIAEKWVAADPALGLRDAAGDVVPLDDPACPRYLDAGRVYTRYPCTARVLPGGQIDYLIRGVNSGTNPASEIVLVDGLPAEGDTGVLLSGQQRGTQWSERPTMRSGVTNVEGYPGVETDYTTAPFPSSGFCTTNLQPPPDDTCPPGAFDAPLGEDVTGFRTTMQFAPGALLDPGESFTLTWSMQAPLSLTTTRDEPVAWNSFAYRPTFQLPGETVTVLPATEPIKVGVGMPMGTFAATKTVDGLPPGVPLEPFAMAFRCTLAIAPGATTEVAEGSFTLTDGATFTGPQVPEGAECRVWETNSQGGESNMAGEQNAAVVMISEATSPVAVDVRNDFASGALSVTKAVVWDDVPPVPIPGPYEVEVDCSFPTPSDSLPGFPQTLQLTDGASETIVDLPVGTTCVVTETETQEAIEVSMAPSNAPVVAGTSVTVLVDPYDPADPEAVPGTTVAVTNTYITGGVRIAKQLTGDAAQWAQGPWVVSVSCVDPLGGLDPVTAEVTLTPDDLDATVSPIPADYACTVTESDVGDAAASSVTPTNFTIPRYDPDPPGPVEVTVTNDYPAGSLRVAKVLAGGASGPMAAAEFTLRVRCERDLAGGVDTQVFIEEEARLRGGENVLVDDTLPLGSRCWVDELDSVGATSVAVSATEADKLTIDADNLEATITATNTYEPAGSRAGVDESGIRVTKRLEGAGVAWARGPFVFATTCTLAGFDLPPFPDLVLDPDNLVGFVNPIPVGATCSVVETDDGTAAGDVPRTVATVTAPAADTDATEVVAVNEFPVAVVDVAKRVVGAGPTGTYRIALACAQDVGGVSEPVDLSGAGAASTLPADPAALLDVPGGGAVGVTVPLGASCAVSEPDNRGALATTITLNGAPATSSFAVTGPVSVVVTNDYTGPDDGRGGGGGLPSTGAGGLGPGILGALLVAVGATLARTVRDRRAAPHH